MKSLRIAYEKSIKVVPAFIVMFVGVSISLYFLTEDVIKVLLENSAGTIYGTLAASLVGSLSLAPGFVAYPLAGMLVEKGIPYMVLAGFLTTLMMVGILTFPLEKKYLGAKVAVIRNVISFVIALVVAFVMGLGMGELSL